MSDVLLVGDPRLRVVSAPVGDPTAPAFVDERELLHAMLARFRREHGFGRAIAAPQIGIAKRFVAVDLGASGPGPTGPFTLVDPEITWRSDETFELWDDCMSFPDLLVRVERNASISLRFTNERGERIEWERLDRACSELFQHELDHLDGVLALDRRLPGNSIVHRSVFDARRDELGD